MDLFQAMNHLNELIAHSATQWWVIPLVTLFCLIDGFFLFLPSETAIVALAAVALSTGEPNVWLLILGSAIGASIGDNIAYYMGKRIGTAGFKWMRRPRVAKAMAWAHMELDKRGAVLILTARYIPVGRVAVNFTAGASQYAWRRFVWLDAIASLTWAGYGVAVGTFAGSWIKHNHLLGVVIAIVFAIIMGFVVDQLIRLAHKFIDKRWPSKKVSAGEASASSDGSATDDSADASTPAAQPTTSRKVVP
ncbi:DedA family protein [Psychromicrobium xiongbiense]|uniref:DedA family protein n=1 Tax=Psychromicrobium xiongbiense TaxID=3051184 RepID=UPI002555E16B|nr:DedA family protein [Psychromicrobium sp. YIM S02556]